MKLVTVLSSADRIEIELARNLLDWGGVPLAPFALSIFALTGSISCVGTSVAREEASAPSPASAGKSAPHGILVASDDSKDSDESEDTEGPDYTTSWPDHTHEIVVYENPYLPSDGAYPIGVSSDPKHSDLQVAVVTVSPEPGRQWLLVTQNDGFCNDQVVLQFLFTEHRVEASVESSGDTYPQPPPAWEDVNGSVAITSWDWTQTQPIVISYDLYGKRGGSWHSVHDKIVLTQ